MKYLNFFKKKILKMDIVLTFYVNYNKINKYKK